MKKLILLIPILAAFFSCEENVAQNPAPLPNGIYIGKSTVPSTGVKDGVMYYNETLDTLFVRRLGVWEALALQKDAGSGGTSLPIDATDVNPGTVSNTEFGYIDGVTSNVQTQLNGKQGTLTFDNTVTNGSANPVTGDGIFDYINGLTASDITNIPTGGDTSTDVQGAIDYLISREGFYNDGSFFKQGTYRVDTGTYGAAYDFAGFTFNDDIIAVTIDGQEYLFYNKAILRDGENNSVPELYLNTVYQFYNSGASVPMFVYFDPVSGFTNVDSDYFVFEVNISSGSGFPDPNEFNSIPYAYARAVGSISDGIVSIDDADITESMVTQHEAALSITKSQITDFPIVTADIGNSQVTLAKIQNIGDETLLGNDSGSAGAPQAITVGAGLALSGGTLTAAPLDLLEIGSHDYWEESQFFNNNSTVNDVFNGAAVASGTQNTGVPANDLIIDGFHEGLIVLRSSTTANGGYRYMTPYNNHMFFGEKSRKFVGVFLWNDSFTDRLVRIGFQDCTTEADAVDGAYFEVAGSTVSAKTANNSTRTTDATTITLTIDTWYRFEIESLADGSSINYKVYNDNTEALLFDEDITTNIPSERARAFAAGVIATEASTTASNIIVMSSMGLGTINGYNKAKDFVDVGGGGSTTTDASLLTTGVLANGRVQESNVTQHESALSIAKSQITGLTITSSDVTDGTLVNADINASAAIAVSKLASGTEGYHLAIVSGVPTWVANSSGSTNASDLVSGTLADARLSSNVPLENAQNDFTATQNDFKRLVRMVSASGSPFAVIDFINSDKTSGYGQVGYTTSTTNGMFMANETSLEQLILKDAGGMTFNGEITATSFVGDGSGLTGVTGSGISTDQTNQIINQAARSHSVNTISGNVTLDATNQVVQSGSTIGSSVINLINNNSATITIPNRGSGVNENYAFNLKGTGTKDFVPGSGVSFTTVDASEQGANTAVRFTGGGRLNIVEESNTVFDIDCDGCTWWTPSTAYAPDNLYTEASAVNADNQSASLGSWVNQSGITTGITQSTSHPTVTLGSGRSIKLLYARSGVSFQRLVLPYSGLTTGVSVDVKFYWRRMQGSTGGLAIEATNRSVGGVSTISTATTDTGWSGSEYTYTFTPSTGSGEIRVYGDYNLNTAGNAEFEMTNFVIEQ